MKRLMKYYPLVALASLLLGACPLTDSCSGSPSRSETSLQRFTDEANSDAGQFDEGESNSDQRPSKEFADSETNKKIEAPELKASDSNALQLYVDHFWRAIKYVHKPDPVEVPKPSTDNNATISTPPKDSASLPNPAAEVPKPSGSDNVAKNSSDKEKAPAIDTKTEVHAVNQKPSSSTEKTVEKPKVIDTCSQFYVRGHELARGATAIVYALNQCVAFDCPTRAVVKEVVGRNFVFNTKHLKKAAELGVGPRYYGHGTCERDGKAFSFVVSQRLDPANFNVIQAYPDHFKDQIRAMLKKIHEAGFTHGDIHLGNILYESTEDPRFYLTDLDKGLALAAVPVDQARDAINAENARAESLFLGDYYPPGGLPNYRTAWQPLIYKWKEYDLNHDGTLDESEEERIIKTIGSQTEGKAVVALYNTRMNTQLNSYERMGLFLDSNNDGEISDREADDISKLFPSLWQSSVLKVRSEYNAFGKNMRTRFTSWSLPPNKREIAPGIKADEVVIIAAGDTRPGRTFPLLTIPLFADFAAKHGYRFEHFNGNLAAPWVPYWNKIWMLLDRMEHAGNKVIVWFDDDGVVSTHSDMVEQYLRAFPDKDVIVSTDPEYWATLNTGVMIVRNTKAAKELLREIIHVGLEWRTVKEGKDYISSSIQLVNCKQGFTCLHEQQALQELFLKIKRECQGTVKCHFGDSQRHTFKDFAKNIQVVPQIEPDTGRNMNLFFDPESPSKLAGRDYLYSKVKRPYRSKIEPFFIQPAGRGERKHEAILKILKAREKR